MLLRRMAERVQEVLGSAGIAARYGGHEFVILLPGSTRVDAERVQRRLDAVVGADPMELDTRVRFSTSIAQLEVGESADSFFRRADDGLYQAKRRSA
jgi:diguanylate cyclase